MTTCALLALLAGSTAAAEPDRPAIADLPAIADAPAEAELPAPVAPRPLRPRVVPLRNDGPAVAELPESLLASEGPTVILVIGAAGAPEYGREFAESAERWEQAAREGNARVVRIGGARAGLADGDARVVSDPHAPRPSGGGATIREPAAKPLPHGRGSSGGAGPNDRERLRAALASLAGPSSDVTWLVFLGHGTFDGRTPRFNLDGPDVTDADLAGWLDPIERPLVVVQCGSCSGAFLPKLSKPGRVVITATKSGSEHNACRFGERLSEAIVASDADLDRDGRTSLLEAWLLACRRTDESYFAEGRIPTEHALLDDNGDGLGVRPDAFRGTRPFASVPGRPDSPLAQGRGSLAPADAPSLLAADGHRAHQLNLGRDTDGRLPPHLRQRRDVLELEIFALRDRRLSTTPEEYDRELERLCLELARLYEAASPLRTAGHERLSRESEGRNTDLR